MLVTTLFIPLLGAALASAETPCRPLNPNAGSIPWSAIKELSVDCVNQAARKATKDFPILSSNPDLNARAGSVVQSMYNYIDSRQADYEKYKADNSFAQNVFAESQIRKPSYDKTYSGLSVVAKSEEAQKAQQANAAAHQATGDAAATKTDGAPTPVPKPDVKPCWEAPNQPGCDNPGAAKPDAAAGAAQPDATAGTPTVTTTEPPPVKTTVGTDAKENAFGGHNVTKVTDDNGVVKSETFVPDANGKLKEKITDTLQPANASGLQQRDYVREGADGKELQHIQTMAGTTKDSNGNDRVVNSSVGLDPKDNKTALWTRDDVTTFDKKTGMTTKEIEVIDKDGKPVKSLRITEGKDPKTGQIVSERAEMSYGKPKDGTVRKITDPDTGLVREFKYKDGELADKPSKQYFPQNTASATAASAAGRTAAAPSKPDNAAPPKSAPLPFKNIEGSANSTSKAAPETQERETAKPPSPAAQAELNKALTAAPAAAKPKATKTGGLSVGKAATIAGVGGIAAGVTVATLSNRHADKKAEAAKEAAKPKPQPKVTTSAITDGTLSGTLTVFRDADGNVTRQKRQLQGTNSTGYVILDETLDPQSNILRGRKTVKDAKGTVTNYVYLDGAYQAQGVASPN